VIDHGERQGYSKREVAAFFGLSVTTVERHIAAGRICAVKIGPRCVRIPATEVDRLAGRVPVGSAAA
jgi:excisionase family DNA binding protein